MHSNGISPRWNDGQTCCVSLVFHRFKQQPPSLPSPSIRFFLLQNGTAHHDVLTLSIPWLVLIFSTISTFVVTLTKSLVLLIFSTPPDKLLSLGCLLACIWSYTSKYPSDHCCCQHIRYLVTSCCGYVCSKHWSFIMSFHSYERFAYIMLMVTLFLCSLKMLALDS